MEKQKGSATIELLLGLVVGAVVVAIAIVLVILPVLRERQTDQSVGIYGTASAAQHASTSQMLVGPQQIMTVFNANEYCANRVIANLASGTTVIVSLASSTPSTLNGFPVVASTTQSFPADLYGCGTIRAFAAASTTITRTEFIR